MRRSFLHALMLGALLATLAATGSGAPISETGQFVLDLAADRPVLDPVDGGRHVVPRLRGFGHTSRPGTPMLPLKVVLVAIPEGSAPTLEILSSQTEPFLVSDLAPVPRIKVRERIEHPREIARGFATGRGAGKEKKEDVQEYEEDYTPGGAGEAVAAASSLRLGKTGYLREQRYVEVLYQPVTVDAAGAATFHSRVRAQVRFDLPTGAAARMSAPFRPDPRFEEIYRAGLANYEQGKLFRVAPGETTAALETAAAMDAAAAQSPAPDLAASPASASVLDDAATSGRYKILVSRPGIYRLDYAYLQANAPELLAADPGTLSLSAEGVEVPITLRTTSTAGAPLVPGDYLEFYGRPKGGPSTLLNYDSQQGFPDIFEANDFTDTQAYWLTASGVPGSHPRIPVANGSPTRGFATASDFQETAVWDENNLFLPLEDADPFFSIPSLMADSTQATRDISLALPGIAAAATPSDVTVRLRGGSNVPATLDHRTRVTINNDSAGGADFTWGDGEVIREQTFTEPRSALTDPATIHFSAPGIAGVTLDKWYIDTVTIRYRRLFAAAGDVLTFSYPNQDARFQVGGFSGVVPAIYEIGRALGSGLEADPVQISGASVSGSPSTTFTFEVARDASPTAPATRTFIVAAQNGIRQPDGISRAADPVLRDPGLSADIIVIGSRATIDPAPGGALDDLLAFRAGAQGLTSKVVFIDQIYDEFSFGLRDPNAIRTFLNYAFDNWKGPTGTAQPPSFLLLVGDATGDYKNTLARPDWIDQVPTAMMFTINSFLGYYSSDNWLGAFRGADQVPDLFLGRISTRTISESDAIFAKILAYEQSPPPGLWKGRMILVAGDEKISGDAMQFETVLNRLGMTYFQAAPYSVPSPPLYFQEPPWNADAAGFQAALTSELDAGAATMTYVGHGSFETLGNHPFFSTADARALTNGPALPFMVNINCFSGGFHYINPIGSFGEGMTNNPAGGAIATLAPSGLSFSLIGDEMTDHLYGALYGKTRERLLGAGTMAFKNALWSLGAVIDLQSYTFLGDPATRIATPAPAPPVNFNATPGDGQVTLAWQASPEPVSGYHLYRSTQPTGPYARITCDPPGPASCVDRSVVNATRYYYYAVSYENDGFEGRWSNFNDDCDAGPGCVTARPLNPNAPSAPTGLAATDPGFGNTLAIAWRANPESDIRSYSLYYGTQPNGPYPSKLSLPLSPTTSYLGGLNDGLRYFMVLTATNTSGKESARSAETSGTPHLIQGIAPPRAITDLTVTPSGADLVLRWSQPTVDIYGRPTVVSGYRVYASSISSFVPADSNRIATLTGGASTTFTHAGAAVLPGNMFYLVTAVDVNGLVSGAGRDLPNGIGGLTVSVVTNSPLVVRLAWPAITTDIQGYESLIDHYQVHRTGVPVGRGSLNSSTIVRDNVQALSVDLDLSGLAGPSFFSVIAVDDRGNLSPF